MSGHTLDVVLSIEFVAAVAWVALLLKLGTRRWDPFAVALVVFFVVLGAIVTVGLVSPWLPFAVVRRLPALYRTSFGIAVNLILAALCLESRTQWRRRRLRRRKDRPA